MSQIQFVIPGPPKGKGRPRFARVGSYVKTYTPEDTASYENLVKVMYKTSCRDTKLEGQLRADIVCYFPIPSSTSKKKKELMIEGNILHTKKPDCDNVAKIVLDSLNQIAFDDDSQVCTLVVQKRYGTEPRVVVRLTEISNKE